MNSESCHSSSTSGGSQQKDAWWKSLHAHTHSHTLDCQDRTREYFGSLLRGLPLFGFPSSLFDSLPPFNVMFSFFWENFTFTLQTPLRNLIWLPSRRNSGRARASFLGQESRSGHSHLCDRLHPSFLDWTEPCQQSDTVGRESRRRKLS